MHTSTDTPYQRMLHLIQKHAPRLMREGAFEVDEHRPKRTSFTPQEVRRMVRLSAAGKSTREIADEMGCARVSVWRQLKKHTTL
jgi:DNA-binding CsgD family transcriptional regulator